MKTSPVRLPNYPIFTQNSWTEVRKFLDEWRPCSQLVTICDAHTAELSLPILQKKTGMELPDPIIIPAGEPAKNLTTCERVWQQFLEKKIDRSGLVLLLGGGVVGDLGGFCAATWKRGVPFVQLPTTLLSMVDSSFGGKLGIDFAGVKNTIGVFQDPKMVGICPEFLATLPARELRSGFAEMAKHALISSKNSWDFLKNSPISLDLDWPALITDSILVKKTVVETDPFEQGLRKILNFGHTIGHALESHFLGKENPLLHGEAIAIGMVCESWISWKFGSLTDAELDEITAFFLKFFGKTTWPEAENPEILALLQHDKKNFGAEIRFALLKNIGAAVWDVPVRERAILESLRFYQRL